MITILTLVTLIFLFLFNLFIYIKKFNPLIKKQFFNVSKSVVSFTLFTYLAFDLFYDPVITTISISLILYLFIFRKLEQSEGYISLFAFVLIFNNPEIISPLQLVLLYTLSIPILIKNKKEYLIAVFIPIAYFLFEQNNILFIVFTVMTIALIILESTENLKKNFIGNLSLSDIFVILITTALYLNAETNLDFIIASSGFFILGEKNKYLQLLLLSLITFYCFQLLNLKPVYNYVISSVIFVSYLFLKRKTSSINNFDTKINLYDLINSPLKSFQLNKESLSFVEKEILTLFYEESYKDNHFSFKHPEINTDTVLILNIVGLNEKSSLEFIHNTLSYIPRYTKIVLYCSQNQKETSTFLPYFKKISTLPELFTDESFVEDAHYLMYINNIIELYPDFLDRFLDHFIDENVDLIYPQLSFSENYQTANLYHAAETPLNPENIYRQRLQEKIEIENCNNEIFMLKLKNYKTENKEISLSINNFIKAINVKAHLALDLYFINKKKFYVLNDPGNSHLLKNIALVFDQVSDFFSYPQDLINALSSKYRFFLINKTANIKDFDLTLKFFNDEIYYASDQIENNFVFHPFLKIPELLFPPKGLKDSKDFKMGLFQIYPSEDFQYLSERFKAFHGPVFPEQYYLSYINSELTYHNSDKFDFKLYNALKFSNVVLSDHPYFKLNNQGIENIEWATKSNFNNFLENLPETFQLSTFIDKFLTTVKLFFQYKKDSQSHFVIIINEGNLDTNTYNFINQIINIENLKLVESKQFKPNEHHYQLFVNVNSLESFLEIDRFSALQNKDKLLEGISLLLENKDYPNIVKYYSRHPLCDSSPEIQNEVAVAYFELRDFENAAKFFKLAAEKNYSEAVNNLKDLEEFLKNGQEKKTDNLQSN